MNSIVTVTFSPCIDKSTTVPFITPDKKLRCDKPLVQPGGGGINVATVLKRFGLVAKALFISGGYAGAYLKHLLDLQSTPYANVEGKEETRENIVVLESTTNRQFRFNMPQGEIYENEWQELIGLLELETGADYIVISGSMPIGLPTNVFEEISKIAETGKAKLIVDTSADALKNSLRVSPFLIKPNLAELAALTGRENIAVEEAEDAARELVSAGLCKNIVVSLADRGAMMVTQDATYTAKPPKVLVRSTIGAGDSMVAGIIYSFCQGMTAAEALRFGVACGTAATMNPGTELCHRKDAEQLFAEVNS